MASSPLRVASIGYAFMGKAHSQAWRNVAAYFDVPPVEQSVLVGRNADAAAAAAAKLGWKSSATHWRSVVTRDDVDIVDICAPGRMHAEIAIAALDAGKHVGWEHTFTHQFAEFLWSIRDGTPSSPSFEDGLRVQRVLAAIAESSNSGGSRIQIN